MIISEFKRNAKKNCLLMSLTINILHLFSKPSLCGKDPSWQTIQYRLRTLRSRHNIRTTVLYFLCHYRDPSHTLRHSRHRSDYCHSDDHHLGQVQALPGETQTNQEEEACGQVWMSPLYISLYRDFHYSPEGQEDDKDQDDDEEEEEEESVDVGLLDNMRTAGGALLLLFLFLSFGAYFISYYENITFFNAFYYCL